MKDLPNQLLINYFNEDMDALNGKAESDLTKDELSAEIKEIVGILKSRGINLEMEKMLTVCN